MTAQVAERIQGDLGRFAAVGDALAATATRRATGRRSNSGSGWRRCSAEEPEVYGLCLAYEPDQGPGRPEEYHLYKCRDRGAEPGGGDDSRLQYKSRRSRMVQARQEPRRPVWTEPFVDTGGGEIPMVSYVVPLTQRRRVHRRADGGPVARVLRPARDWLTELNFGPRSYGFVVSQDGNVLSHPDPEYDFGQRFEAGHKAARELTDPDATDPAFAALTRRMLKERERRGSGDRPLDRPAGDVPVRPRPARPDPAPTASGGRSWW